MRAVVSGFGPLCSVDVTLGPTIHASLHYLKLQVDLCPIERYEEVTDSNPVEALIFSRFFVPIA